MSYRNQNRNRHFGNNYVSGVPMGGVNRGNMGISPWENPHSVANFGGGGGGTNMRQEQGGVNAQAINLANNLLSNLFRNQNPPSLLDLPRGGNMGNRLQRGGPMVNRGSGNGLGNRLNNRRGQGGFQNRTGSKSAQKPSTSSSGGGSGGIRKQNAFDRAKKILAKNANNNNSSNSNNQKKKETSTTSNSAEKKPESSKECMYESVPNDMFYCHLCKKHMWDANSFENHIKGRTHLMMREGIEESYRLKANMIRQEAKIAEQLKSIELDRLKRMGKSKQRQLDYCTMCDLNFHGHISAHRKSEGHLLLKKFLHPKCNECTKEFATRIDYDTHLLSADHLKKAAEKNTKVGERIRPTLAIISEEEELRDVRPPQKRKKKLVQKMSNTSINSSSSNANIDKDTSGTSTNNDTIDSSKKDQKQTSNSDDNNVDDADNEEAEKKYNPDEDADTKEGDDLDMQDDEEEVVLPVDPDDCILDYNEGDEIPTEVENRLPKYNWTRPVGAGLITKLQCYECCLCNKFFDTEKTVEIHSRTVTHHRNFLKFLNEKSSDTKIAQKRAAAAIEENERKKRKFGEIEDVQQEGNEKEQENTASISANGGADDEDKKIKITEEFSKDDTTDVQQVTNEDEDYIANDDPTNDEAVIDNLEESKVTTNINERRTDNDNSGATDIGTVDDGEDADTAGPSNELPAESPGLKKIKMEPVDTVINKNDVDQQQTTQQQPVKKGQQTPIKMQARNRGGGNKNISPRGRGRGRYNRY